MTRRAHLRRLPTIADSARAFGPVDSALDQLSRGFIMADQNGTPMCVANGNPTPLAEALEGWALAWRRLLDHYRSDVDVSPLESLACALSGGDDIPQGLVSECQSVVASLKRAFRKMNVYEVKSICNTVSIGILLEDKREAA